MRFKLINIILSFLLLAPAVQADFGMTSQITRSVSQNIAKNLFDNLIIPELKVRNPSGQIKDIKLSPDQQFLFLLFQDGTARAWDLGQGVQRPMVKLSSGDIDAIAFDAKQKLLFTAQGNLIRTHDILTASETDSFSIKQKIINFDFSGATGEMLLTTENSVELWHLQSKTQVWHKPITNGKVVTARFIADKPMAVIHKREDSLFSSKDWLEVISVKTGDEIQNLSNDGEQVVYFGQHALGLEVGYQDGQLVIWNIETAQMQSEKTLGNNLVALDVMSNDSHVYVTNNGQAVINTPEGKLFTLKKEGLEIKAAFLLQHGRRVITAMDNGLVLVWDATTGEEMLQMISTKQGWTAIDSFGRFDSSEKGMANVSWQAANQDLPLDNFSGKYYEPGVLMTALTGGEFINKKRDAVKAGITLPPKLELSVNGVRTSGDKVELTVDVYDQGGGIGKVSVFHNSKAVQVDKILQDKKEFVEQNRQRHTMKLLVKPLSGGNKLKVVAANKGGIEGLGAEAEFHHDKAPEPSTLRVITIGVNQYKDERLNLDYSVADAQTISSLMDKSELIGFNTVDKFNIYNSNATKLSILTTLNQVSQGKQEDVMAIYFAGHGISVNGEWYFLPYETTLQPDLNYFATVGISATELSEVFMGSNVQKIFLMVDACYSGESVTSFKRLQNSQRHFSRAISRSVGITVLTATRRDQEAAELSDLGHGLFTYVVTKGMKGEADWWPKNNQVSVHELATFSTKTIPEFSKKYLEAAQEPTAFTMGKDFPLFKAK